MSEEQKEILRNQLETFNTPNEVCDLLNISVEELLVAFDINLQNYVNGIGGDDNHSDINDRGYY